MLMQASICVALLSISPPGAPPDYAGDSGICIPMTPGLGSVDVDYFDGERPDGANYWGVAAAYELSTGDIGEFHMLIDHGGAGEAHFSINGEIVSHVSSSTDEDGINSASMWGPARLSYSAELLAELMQGPVARDVIDGMFTQEFRCSRFGEKVMKGAKYALYALTGALAATCCAGTVTVGCVVCAAGASAAAGFGADQFDGYCDQ